jgi:hypothetical protein
MCTLLLRQSSIILAGFPESRGDQVGHPQAFLVMLVQALVRIHRKAGGEHHKPQRRNNHANPMPAVQLPSS